MRDIVPKEDEDVAQYYIGLFREGQLAPIEGDIDPALKTPNLHGELGEMLALIPHQYQHR